MEAEIKVSAELASSESLSLACKWPSSPYAFTWSSLCVCLISSHKYIHYIGLGLTQITLFYLNYLFIDSVSKYNLILRYWGLRL